MLGSPVCPHFI